MAVNLEGPFFLTQAVAKAMIALLKTGTIHAPKIVNIGSISAYTASVNRAEYCISKAGMAMMTALFADRLATEGINVYEIRPGIIETDLTSVAKAKYDALIADGLTPIRRWGQPEDVAAGRRRHRRRLPAVFHGRSDQRGRRVPSAKTLTMDDDDLRWRANAVRVAARPTSPISLDSPFADLL